MQTPGAPTRRGVEESARKIEDLGYFALLVNDHVIGPGPDLGAAATVAQPVAAIPTVQLIAAATTTLRVGFRVIPVDYWNPTVLAKTLATLDLFSDGRLEVGLGAGWVTAEYEAIGVPMDKPSVRIARLGEVVDILRGLFAPGVVSVEGAHGVRAVGFEGLPRPVQQPGPPIAIGGGGRKLLELAARAADIVCFSYDNRAGVPGGTDPTSSTAAATTQKLGWVHDAAAGRAEQPELEIGAYSVTVTDDDPRDAAEAMSARVGLAPDEILRHPHTLIGTVDAICDTIVERRETYGFSYWTVLERNVDAFAQVVARLAGT